MNRIAFALALIALIAILSGCASTKTRKKRTGHSSLVQRQLPIQEAYTKKPLSGFFVTVKGPGCIWDGETFWDAKYSGHSQLNNYVPVTPKDPRAEATLAHFITAQQHTEQGVKVHLVSEWLKPNSGPTIVALLPRHSSGMNFQKNYRWPWPRLFHPVESRRVPRPFELFFSSFEKDEVDEAVRTIKK